MAKIKGMFPFVLCLALAACQQTGDSAPRSTAVAEKDPLVEALESSAVDNEKLYKPTPYFKAKVKDLMVRMMDRLLTRCLDAGSEPQMNACFRERLLAGFDRDGIVETHCPAQPHIGDDVKCIVLGGMSWDVASKLDHGTVPDIDWADPEKSTSRVMLQLVAQHLRSCLGSGSASDPFDCVVGGITKTLDLSASDLDPCAEYKDDDIRFGNCVGEAYGYKYLNSAVARI